MLHLGDFCMKSASSNFLKKLNGQKVLLRGNHDKGSYAYHISQGWHEVIEGVNLSLKTTDEEERLLCIIQSEIGINRLAQSLVNFLIMDYDNERIMFSHFPVFDDNPFDEKFKPIISVLEELYILTDCSLNIHGHIHSKLVKEPFCKNVCVEHYNFQPLLLNQLLSQ